MTTEKSDKPRTRKLNVDLTDAEMLKLRGIANVNLMSRDDFLAHMIRTALSNYSSPDKED